MNAAPQPEAPIAAPYREAPLRIKTAEADSFFVYGESDSISMTTPGYKGSYVFKKLTPLSSRWKPRPQYDNQLLLMGTFVREDLPGMIISFYCSNDKTSLLQLFYTNPGNLCDAILFSKDSINILAKAGLIIDPKAEVSEPEKGIPSLQ